MKKLFTILAISYISFAFGQGLSVTSMGNEVTFTFDDSDNLDWGVNAANGFNIYLFIADVHTSQTLTAPIEISPWPGSAWTNTMGDVYEFSVDLENFIDVGETVNDIRFIYTDDNGNQNPQGFGNSFSAVDKGGFTPLTITALSTSDLTKNDTKLISYASNKLIVSEAGDYVLTVYNPNGQVVKQDRLVGVQANQPIQLNLDRGNYIIQTQHKGKVENLKVIVR